MPMGLENWENRKNYVKDSTEDSVQMDWSVGLITGVRLASNMDTAS